VGASNSWVATDPLGLYVYATQSGVNDVTELGVALATGTLTSLSEEEVATQTGPTGMAVDPSGKFAYAVNSGSNTVTAFDISQTDGTLTVITGEFGVATGSSPAAIAVTGTFH
jgi:6-phosphogluconolactonase